VAEDKVIITPGGINTMIAALNNATGETLWKSESIEDTSAFISPLLIQIAEKKQIVTGTKKHIVAVDFNTGKIVWKEKSSSNGFVPLPYHHEIYFPKLGGDGKMVSISNDQNKCIFKWNDTMKVNSLGGGVRIGNRIYGALGKSKGLFCLDWETGKTLSVNKDVSYAHFIVADSMIYGYEGNGRIVLVKPKGDNTELVSSFKIKQGKGQHLAHMSIGNGLLFIRHGKYLMAYDVNQP
jgi:outer membrane protein assembly factor BamB